MPYRSLGWGTEICNLLVNISLKTDPTVKITARTISEENFSTRILQKDNFKLMGTVIDPQDGEVWVMALYRLKLESMATKRRLIFTSVVN